jgi:energy-coupling factor transport system substrate-specific component
VTGSRAKVTTAFLLTCAAIGVATGLLIIPATAFSTLTYPLVPPLSALVGGAWIVGFVIAMRLLERPGAAVLTGLISGLVATPFSATGPAIIVTNVMFAAFVELPFLVILYRRWYRWLFYAGAALVTALYAVWTATAVNMSAFAGWVLPLYVVALFASNLGAVALGIFVADRLTRAGVARLARRRSVVSRTAPSTRPAS